MEQLPTKLADATGHDIDSIWDLISGIAILKDEDLARIELF